MTVRMLYKRISTHWENAVDCRWAPIAMCLYSSSLLRGHEPPHMRIHRTARVARGLHDIRAVRCVALHYKLQITDYSSVLRMPALNASRAAPGPFPGARIACELQ